MSHILESIRLDIGDTTPTGLQAAARLMGERNKKYAKLALEATTACGTITLLCETLAQFVSHGKENDQIFEAEQVRDALLKAIQELGNV